MYIDIYIYRERYIYTYMHTCTYTYTRFLYGCRFLIPAEAIVRIAIPAEAAPSPLPRQFLMRTPE